MKRQDIYNFIDRAESGCWNWTRAKDGKGYGVVYVSYRISAHRLSYEMAYGPIPQGKHVLHRCDNPACINPEHLFIGTHRDNMRDKETKGRANHVRNPGVKNPQAFLTDARVIALLRDYIDGVPRKVLAKKYGLRESSISSYTDGQAWTHLHGKHGCPTLDELKAAKRRTPGAKIDADTARDIKARLDAGELGIDLAAAYGIHKATISDIRRGKIWRDA